MHLDPFLPKMVGVTFVVLLLGLLLRHFKQPHIVVYLLTGVAPMGSISLAIRSSWRGLVKPA